MMPVKIINILAILILIVLSLAILANSMSKPLGRDEQMYCSGSALLAQGKMIYRDFSYAAQLPYHPLICATLFRMFNTTHYLLIGRMLSAFCDILVLVCIVGIYRHIFKSFAITGMLLGLAAAVLYVFNPLVDYANGYAWNHDAVIFCVVLAFWLFVSTDFTQKSKYWRIAAIGALLTFASCMRITTALVELLFFAIILSQPAETIKQRFKTALPFLIAAALVSAWPVWVIAQAPRAFFLNLVKIPMLYGEWLHQIGMVFNKFELTLACLTQPGYFVILVLGIYLCLVTLYLRRRLKIPDVRALLLAALLPLTFLIIALIPPTMWRQYLAMPVPFLVIGFALPLLYLRKLTDKSSSNKHFKIAAGLVGVCVFVAVTSYPVVLKRTPLVLVPERWEPIEIHKISEDIAEKLKTQNSKLILTLAPLLALEGGCDIYTELSCGAIIYRAADSMSPYERGVTHTVGPKTLEELLKTSPPSAVILNVERGKLASLEAPLQAVVKPDWERKVYENGFVAYFKP
jgi:4-amino-4-deoxy-L-arabinose transferase-like glycosyltransferase